MNPIYLFATGIALIGLGLLTNTEKEAKTSDTTAKTGPSRDDQPNSVIDDSPGGSNNGGHSEPAPATPVSLNLEDSEQ